MSWLLITSALWLGVLTSISPCPMATNIAAISFISRRVNCKSRVLLSGLLYTLGRMLAYIGLGAVISGGFLATGELSRFLQKHMAVAIGPVLIVLGLVLLGWIGGSLSVSLVGGRMQEKVRQGGLWWDVPIGALFALSFCPVSAGLFFAGLIPLSLEANSPVVLPVVYAVGTALPVLAFAFILAFAGAYIGKAYNVMSVIDRWVRGVAGAVFILAGIYYCITRVYCV